MIRPEDHALVKARTGDYSKRQGSAVSLSATRLSASFYRLTARLPVRLCEFPAASQQVALGL